jgi:methionyl-tRNA synthetase
VLLHPYMPASTDRLLAALGSEDRSLASARWDTTHALGEPIGQLESLFPKSA